MFDRILDSGSDSTSSWILPAGWFYSRVILLLLLDKKNEEEEKRRNIRRACIKNYLNFDLYVYFSTYDECRFDFFIKFKFQNRLFPLA